MGRLGKNILIFCCVEIILGSLLAFTESRSYYVKREQQLYIAANEANYIESCFEKVSSKVYTLAAMIVENNGDTSFFEDNAEYIYSQKSNVSSVVVKNLAVAPNGIVSKVYPSVGNEDLIGLNFLDDTQEGNASAIEAFNQGKLVLTNPFNLKQGGIGIGCRLPVYLNNGSTFWGIVTITFDFTNLIEMFNFKNLETAGSNYEVSYIDDNNQKQIIEKSSKFKGNHVNYSFKINNLSWEIKVKPNDYWINPVELVAGIFITLVFSFGIAYIAYSRNKIANTNVMLEQIANKDNLTSCFSRNYVNKHLVDISNGEWINKNNNYSMAIVDVDNFKSINDTYGHDVGDRALVAVANELQSICISKNNDCVIRYGGDEFILLLSNVDQEKAQKRLNLLIQNINGISFEDIPNFKISVSIGVTISSNEVHKYTDLFSESDKKIYTSKKNGKNQYTF